MGWNRSNAVRFMRGTPLGVHRLEDRGHHEHGEEYRQCSHDLGHFRIAEHGASLSSTHTPYRSLPKSQVYIHVIFSPPLRIYEPHPYPGDDPLTKYSQPLPGPHANSARPPMELT